MNVEVKEIRRRLAMPTRDWRFWAASCATLMTITAAIGMVAVIRDRNDWRDRFEVASGQQACRAKAAADVNLAGYRLIGVIGEEDVALNHKDQIAIDAVALRLPVLTRSVADAIARQQEAATACLDPAYVKAHT